MLPFQIWQAGRQADICSLNLTLQRVNAKAWVTKTKLKLSGKSYFLVKVKRKVVYMRSSSTQSQIKKTQSLKWHTDSYAVSFWLSKVVGNQQQSFYLNKKDFKFFLSFNCLKISILENDVIWIVVSGAMSIWSYLGVLPAFKWISLSICAKKQNTQFPKCLRQAPWSPVRFLDVNISIFFWLFCFSIHKSVGHKLLQEFRCCPILNASCSF